MSQTVSLAEDPSLAIGLAAGCEASHPILAQEVLPAMLVVDPAARPSCRKLLRLPALQAYLSREASQQDHDGAERSWPEADLASAAVL